MSANDFLKANNIYAIQDIENIEQLVLLLDSYIVEQNKKENQNIKVDYEAVVDLFHLICPDLPAVRLITKSRKSAINARVKEAKPDDVIEFFLSVFQSVTDSPFLTGKTTAWRASFDWIFNPSNFLKIIEGNYVSKTGTKSSTNNSQWGASGAQNISRPSGKQSYFFEGTDVSV